MQTLKVRLQLSENFDFTQTSLTLLKQEDMILNRGSHQRRSIKKGVLRNFAIFTWKYLCQSLFLIKLQALGVRPASLLKKRLWRKCFPVNFAKFLGTPSLQNASGWLFLAKLPDPNRRKIRLPCFELRWLLNGMNMPWYYVLSFFLLFFCLETTL